MIMSRGLEGKESKNEFSEIGNLSELQLFFRDEIAIMFLLRRVLWWIDGNM
jgi:hypothetical protein